MKTKSPSLNILIKAVERASRESCSDFSNGDDANTREVTRALSKAIRLSQKTGHLEKHYALRQIEENIIAIKQIAALKTMRNPPAFCNFLEASSTIQTLWMVVSEQIDDIVAKKIENNC